MTDVTVFFRDSKSWGQPDWRQPTEGEEDVSYAEVMWKIEGISDNDAKKLTKLLNCIHELWEEARKKGEIERLPEDIDGEKIFDNYALDRFISDLALLLDNIQSRRHIRDYIIDNKAKFTIEVPLELPRRYQM